MRVAILGAGAMGSWFGGRLAESGTDVQLLTTNKAHRDAINSNGLILDTQGRRSTIVVLARAPEEIEAPVDLIILLTKSFQSRDAMNAVAHAIGETTHVLSLQNGLGNSEIIEAFLPRERILIGNTMMPVDRIAAGVVRKTGNGITRFSGVVSQDLPLTAKILDAFSDTDIDIEHDESIQKAVWEKVAFNAGMNAVCALARGTPGNIGAATGAIELVKQVAAEVAAVGLTQGVVLDLDSVNQTIEYACANHKNHQPSMLQDLLAGKRTEVDALNGAIVTIAAGAGVPVPLNEVLFTLIKMAEDSSTTGGG